MATGVAFAAKEGGRALAEGRDVGGREAVEGAGQGGLGRKLGPPPRLGQGQIGPEPGIDLDDGPASGQDTDQEIEHVGVRPMPDGFERHGHGLQHRGEKAATGQAIAHHSQGGKGRRAGHGNQFDSGTHGSLR